MGIIILISCKHLIYLLVSYHTSPLFNLPYQSEELLIVVIPVGGVIQWKLERMIQLKEEQVGQLRMDWDLGTPVE